MDGANCSDVAKLSKAPIAVEAVRRIDEIFAIERTINGRTAADRLAVRQDRSKPLVLELEAFLREKRALLSARSETAKAISYSLNHWAAFARFLDDGRILMRRSGPVSLPQPKASSMRLRILWLMA